MILAGTRLSEVINTFLRNRWPDFSRQNYFDEHGIFMGVMWAGPLLILGFTMLVRGTLRHTVVHPFSGVNSSSAFARAT